MLPHLTDLPSANWPPQFIFLKCHFKTPYSNFLFNLLKALHCLHSEVKISKALKVRLSTTCLQPSYLNSFNPRIAKPVRLTHSFIHSIIFSSIHQAWVECLLFASYYVRWWGSVYKDIIHDLNDVPIHWVGRKKKAYYNSK